MLHIMAVMLLTGADRLPAPTSTNVSRGHNVTIGIGAMPGCCSQTIRKVRADTPQAVQIWGGRRPEWEPALRWGSEVLGRELTLMPAERENNA